MPPYTTKSSGASATWGSRLFISIRKGASVNQDLVFSFVPVGDFMMRGFFVFSNILDGHNLYVLNYR